MAKKGKGRPQPKAAGGSSKFWLGLLLGGGVAASAVHYGPGWLKDLKPETWLASGGESGETASGESAGASQAGRQTGSQDPGTRRARAPQPAVPSAPAAPVPGTAHSSPLPAGSTGPDPAVPARTASAPRGGHGKALPPAAGPVASPAPSGKIPAFFQDPPLAASLLTRLGMGESHRGSLLWKNTDALGWNSFGVLNTSPSHVSTQGSASGNTVTCLLESRRADRVEAIRLTANVHLPREGEATMVRFKSLAQAVLQETGCPVTREFLAAIDGTRSLSTETAEARYILAQRPLAPGTRWELSVEAR